MVNKIKKWGVYKADLEPVLGSEQGKSRPVLIVSEDFSNDVLNCVNILPITSRKENRNIYPNEVLLPIGTSELLNESIVLCHQIRTIDKRRISNFYGEIGETNIQTEILNAICFQLGIDLFK